MNNLVSVIITIYNDEDLIRSCVESIRMQTYANLEIILVMDGSVDKSKEICDDYARRDSRIKVLHNHKGGPSEAKNLGLKIMTGDYVYFLDGVDYVEKTLIETALSIAIESSVDLLVFNYNKIDEYDNLLSPIRFSSSIYEIDDSSRIMYIINILEQYGSDGWQVGNRLFKSDIVRRNDIIFWDNDLISDEDIGFSLNYTLYLSKISYISDVLYYYRIKEDSIRAEPQKEPRILEAIELFNLMEYRIRSSFKDKNVIRIFEVLLFGLLYEQLAKLHSYNYKKSLSSLEDKSSSKYFYSRIRRITKRPILLIKSYGFVKGIGLLLLSIFISSRRMKKTGIFIIHMINKLEMISETFKYNKGKIMAKRRIFLIGCEDFWNLGDHHIGISEIEYLEENFPEYAIVEITASNYFAVNRILPLIIRRKNLICLHGGGNMGNFYMLAEYIRRDIMKKFRNNEKVIFPQTIHYDDSIEGKAVLMEDQDSIKRTKNLTLCVREEYSYELAKEYFDCHIVLTPDIVLFSNYSDKFISDREGAILLLRKDLESVMSAKDKQSIKNVLQQYTSEIRINDTQLITDIDVYDRRVVMDEFISKIAKAEIVVTDRLHGMVFCAITKTPCIVLPNYNHKVEGVYDWISELEYIIMIQDMTELEGAVKSLLNIERIIYDNSLLVEKFQALTMLVKSKVS